MDRQALIQRIGERTTLDMQRMARLRTLWLKTYRYYGLLLHPDQEELYAEDTMDFDPCAVGEALREWRLTPPKGEQKPRAPLPVDILPMLQGYVSPDARATEMACDIFAAFSDIGRNDIEGAQRHLGEEAWGLVKRLGGWQKLCADAEGRDRFVFQAQVRDMAKGALERQRNSRIAATASVVGHLPEAITRTPQALPPEPMAHEPRRLPAPSRHVDEINAMVAKLVSRWG